MVALETERRDPRSIAEVGVSATMSGVLHLTLSRQEALDTE